MAILYRKRCGGIRAEPRQKLTIERFHFGLILAIGHDADHKMNQVKCRQTLDEVAYRYALILNQTGPGNLLIDMEALIGMAANIGPVMVCMICESDEID